MPDIPEGVSSIGNNGERKSVQSSSADARRQRAPKNKDVIDTSRGRRVDPYSPPPGVMNRRVDIVEIPIEGQRDQSHIASFTSCDGIEYNFRTHDTKGNADPRRETLCLFLALRETALGGSPVAVFDAFRLRINDMDGKQVFPIVDRSEVSESSVSFSLGE